MFDLVGVDCSVFAGEFALGCLVLGLDWCGLCDDFVVLIVWLVLVWVVGWRLGYGDLIGWFMMLLVCGCLGLFGYGVVFVCCYVGGECVAGVVGLQMYFVISACWGLWCYDVVGVIVNSVVDVRGVFDMFVMVLACLDFDLVFIQLVGV